MEKCSFYEQEGIVCAAAVSLLSRCVGKDSACMDVCIGGRRWSREPDGGRVGRRAGSGACILHFPDKAQERFLSMTRHAPRIRGKSRNRTLGKPGFRRKKKIFLFLCHLMLTSDKFLYKHTKDYTYLFSLIRNLSRIKVLRRWYYTGQKTKSQI